MVDERLGRLQVDVASARQLQEPQQAALIRQLETITGKQVRLKLTVDDDLVGGLVVRIGDWVYDTSVRTRLEMIRNHLIERSSHDIQGGRDRFGD